MAKRSTRSRQQAAQRALTRLLLAQVAEMISRPGPLAAALQARFGSTATTLEMKGADVAWRISWPAGHALAGREFFTLDFEVAKTRVLEGALVEPLHGRFLRGVGLHLPGANGGDPELIQRFKPWVNPKNEKTATAERLFAGDAVLSVGYNRAAWRPSRGLQRDLRTAGALVARVFGESVGPYEPVGFLDGEPEPQTLDEAFVLLRRLAERSGLSPMGVLRAFVAGNLAATSLGDAFPGLRDAELVQRPASALIAIDVLPDGRVLMSSTCQGRLDSRYAPLDDQRAPQEVRRLLGELRERLSLPPSSEATHG